MFEALDKIYEYFAGIFKVSAPDVNLAWTPEILGTGLETLETFALTPLGQLLANIAGAGICGIAMVFAPLGDFDRKIIGQLAAHLGSRIMRIAFEPQPALSAQAYSLGRALASYDIESVKNTLVKAEGEIKALLSGMGVSFAAPSAAVAAPSPETFAAPTVSISI